MRRTRAFAAALVALTACGAAFAGVPARPSVADHLPQIDGPMTTGTDSSGRAWAVWSYRASGEFDIAVATKPAGALLWSAPAFIGRRDGVDQVDPVLEFDASGTAYVVFATRGPARIGVSVLTPRSTDWSAPLTIPGSEGGFSPAVRVVRDRLVVAYRTAKGVIVVDFPTVGASSGRIRGIEDSPDSVDPLGAIGGEDGGGNTGGGDGSPLPTDEDQPAPQD